MAVFPHLNLQINVFCEKLSVCITALKSYSKIQWFKTIDIISDNSELLLGRSSGLLYWVRLGWDSLARCQCLPIGKTAGLRGFHLGGIFSAPQDLYLQEASTDFLIWLTQGFKEQPEGKPQVLSSLLASWWQVSYRPKQVTRSSADSKSGKLDFISFMTEVTKMQCKRGNTLWWEELWSFFAIYHIAKCRKSAPHGPWPNKFP